MVCESAFNGKLVMDGGIICKRLQLLDRFQVIINSLGVNVTFTFHLESITWCKTGMKLHESLNLQSLPLSNPPQ